MRCAPSLRERREDIPALITHFVTRHGDGHSLADETMKALVEYDWPGNIRELEHTVQRMVAMNSGPWLTAADLPSAVVNRAFERRFDASPRESSGPASSPFGAGVPEVRLPSGEARHP